MAIALVNKTTQTNDAGATTLAATAASHTTGNLLVVGVVWSGNFTSSIPTDTALNTYVSTTQKANKGTTDHVEIFYAKNITGNASNIVTAHFSGSATFRRIMVYQYSGCDTTAPYTTGEGGTASVLAATSITSTSWTPATADEVLTAFMGSTGAGSSIVAGTGYTIESLQLGGDATGEDRIVSSIASYTGGYTWTTAQDAWLAAASFKIAGAVAGSKGVQPIVSREAQRRASRW